MLALNRLSAATLILPAFILGCEAIWIATNIDVSVDLRKIFTPSEAATTNIAGPETISVPMYDFDYRPSGVHVTEGKEVDAGVERRLLASQLLITRDQITEADYAACVQAGACDRVKTRWPSTGEARPVTGVSFDDATKYAAWLSHQTEQIWRLPTDEEWVAAAGSRARDDAVGINATTNNPAARWLDAYAQQNQARNAIGPPQPTGFFGSNEFGIKDMSGNVWEWTNTCFSRTRKTLEGEKLSVLETCAVRVVQGLHRTYISTFIRDAKAGGCSVGAPPNHLGFRLVREFPPGPLTQLNDWFAFSFNKILMRV